MTLTYKCGLEGVYAGWTHRGVCTDAKTARSQCLGRVQIVHRRAFILQPRYDKWVFYHMIGHRDVRG